MFPSSTTSTKLSFWLLLWLPFWPPSQSSRTFTLLFAFDESVISGDTERRGSPAVFLTPYPLSIIIISESTQEETSLSRSAIHISFEIYFSVCLNYVRSGSASVFPKPFNHQNSWMARPLPPPAHQIEYPWFSFELLETCWWSEFLGPSVLAQPPAESRLAHKTLIWFGVPFSGLGPQYQQQPLGPTSSSLKINFKVCGLSFRVLKPIYRINFQAHLTSISRSVYFLSLSNPIFLMWSYSETDGRRLHPSRLATYLDWFVSNHSRVLMASLLWVSSEDNSLLKNSAYIIEIEFRIQLTQRHYKPFLRDPKPCFRTSNQSLIGYELNSQGQPDYKLCVEFLNLHGQWLHVREDPPALVRLVTHQMRFPVSSSSKATSI